MANTIKKNSVIVTMCVQRIGALKKFVAKDPAALPIPVAGKVCSGAEVIAMFQRSLDTRATVDTCRAALHAALAERANAEAQRRKADASLKAWVTNLFGPDSHQSHEFGYPPSKAAEKTVESKANAVRLNKATREARGTLGKKAKLKIKGKLPDTSN